MKDSFPIETFETINVQEFEKVSLILRCFIGILDLTVFSLLAYYTTSFFTKQTELENFHSLPLIIISFYSILFIAIEYYLDGSIIKNLSGMVNVSRRGITLRFLSYVLKFFFRFIALLLGYLYVASLLIVLLIIIRIFGGLKNYYGIAWDFINGVTVTVWYDDIINQDVIYIKKPVVRSSTIVEHGKDRYECDTSNKNVWDGFELRRIVVTSFL